MKIANMGFFDTIEKLQTTGPECRLQETISDPVIQAEATVDQPELGAKKKAANKPENLAFLPPCQACGGRDFIFTDDGRFACSACQPGIPGEPVKSTGPDRPQPDQDTYLIGDSMGNSSWSSPPARPVVTREQENFTAAWPWIKEHLSELLASGWSRAALIGRGKFRHPVGSWGVAWLSVWRERLLTVEINSHGNIVFTYPIRGRLITKTAQKPNKLKKDKKVHDHFLCNM